MSMATTYTCDYCGGTCTGNVYASLWGDGDETKAYKHERLDGCTKDHLGFAVAKAFEIPIDGNMSARIDELTRATRNIPGLEGMLKNVTENYERHKKDAAAQIDELQRKLTGAQYEADEAKEKLSRLEHAERDARAIPVELIRTAAKAMRVVVDFLENDHDEAPSKDLADAISGTRILAAELEQAANLTIPTKPKVPFAGNDHPHEVGSCECDKETAKDFTPPIKPTKPALTEPCPKCLGRGEMPCTNPNAGNGTIEDCDRCNGFGKVAP